METADVNAPQQKAGALVYWRKGARYVPSIMILDGDDVLSLTAADQAQVFREPLTQLGIRFMAWGTLLIETGGVTHAIRSSGGLAAGQIPAWQAQAARKIGQAGVFIGTMRKWQEVFIAAGAPLKRRQMRAMSILVLTLIIVVIATALLAGHK